MLTQVSLSKPPSLPAMVGMAVATMFESSPERNSPTIRLATMILSSRADTAGASGAVVAVSGAVVIGVSLGCARPIVGPAAIRDQTETVQTRIRRG